LKRYQLPLDNLPASAAKILRNAGMGSETRLLTNEATSI
jgi:hypothetical protein